MSLIGLLLRGFGPIGASEVNPVEDSLAHSPADIIRHLFIQLGLGTLKSNNGLWPISAISELPTPDNTITVYDTSGTLGGRIQKNGIIHEQYGIAVRVRSLDPIEGYRKVDAIKSAMDQSIKQNVIEIDEYRYLINCVNRKGGILSIGKESPTSSRNLYTLNALANIQQVN